MLRRSSILALILLPGAVFAQSPFAGKWQARKGAITVTIALTEGKVSGTVILVVPHKDRLEMTISSSENKGTTLEFETMDRGDTWFWRLTLTNKTRGLLQGSVRHILIDERVKKRS